MNYKGKDAYQTKVGLLCTVLAYVLIVINGVALWNGFLDGSKQKESAQTVFYDRYHEGKFYLQEGDFHFKIAYRGQLDPGVGRILVSLDTTEEKEKID